MVLRIISVSVNFVYLKKFCAGHCIHVDKMRATRQAKEYVQVHILSSALAAACNRACVADMIKDLEHVNLSLIHI